MKTAEYRIHWLNGGFRRSRATHRYAAKLRSRSLSTRATDGGCQSIVAEKGTLHHESYKIALCPSNIVRCKLSEHLSATIIVVRIMDYAHRGRVRIFFRNIEGG